MRRNRLKVLLACTLVGGILGCGMTGSWSSASLSPEVARNEFAMFGQKPPHAEFTQADVTLRDDGTYTADVHYGNVTVHSDGTWEQQDGQITFVDDKGVSKTYQANLSGDHKELVLVRSIEGTDVKLKLKRKI